LNPSEIKKLFTNKATELGISEIGFTDLKSMGDEFSRFKNWIDNGYHADMKWLERNHDKRHNPSKVIDADSGTAIVCLLSYNTGRYYNKSFNSDANGKIAQYAWGRDYHDVVPKTLNELVKRVKSESGIEFPNRIYSDTGPLLERDLAVKAGVGWRGKNSLILNKKLGSYTFIGIILTSIELPIDEPLLDRCGTCTLCLDNCPTGAIISPYIVDSNKCISYLTIESPVDKELNEDLSGWIYGCDVCQMVCPYNNIRNPLSPIESFYQNKFGSSIKPETVFQMKEEEYNLKKEKSAIKRAGLEGLKRNAREIIYNNESKRTLDQKN
jgi:epoxyqueuosine reductase